jgi:hypothetical protein
MNDNLSRAASAIWLLSQSHAEAAHYDAMFDGGEWSAAAHQDMEANEQDRIARRFGFEHAEALWNAIEARTSARWMHCCFPSLLADDPYEHDSIHGRSKNQ